MSGDTWPDLIHACPLHGGSLAPHARCTADYDGKPCGWHVGAVSSCCYDPLEVYRITSGVGTGACWQCGICESLDARPVPGHVQKGTPLVEVFAQEHEQPVTVHSLPPPPDAYDGPEPNLQRECENWLRSVGYVKALPSDSDAQAQLDPVAGRRGWYVHYPDSKAKGLPQAADLVITAVRAKDRPGEHRALHVELKCKRHQWQPGQRARVESGQWALAHSLGELQRTVAAWEGRG